MVARGEAVGGEEAERLEAERTAAAAAPLTQAGHGPRTNDDGSPARAADVRDSDSAAGR